jgi:signal transduction histidine kinase
LRVHIEDNGRGFDPGAEPPTDSGLRFHALGGRFNLSSRPGQGSRVEMTIPLKAAERA